MAAVHLVAVVFAFVVVFVVHFTNTNKKWFVVGQSENYCSHPTLEFYLILTRTRDQTALNGNFSLVII